MLAKNKYFIVFSIAICIGLFGVNVRKSDASAASAGVTTPGPVQLFYFVDSPTARLSLFAHPESIDILAPQAYDFDVNGLLEGGVDQTVIDFAHRNNIKIMPVVTNGDFDQVSLSSIFSSTDRQNLAINMLIAVAKQEGYAGWQLDFEQMNVSDKDEYSAFVKKVYDAFTQQGLELSVAVIAKTSDNPTDYPKNLWTNLIGAYDYSALAANSDFVSVMAYDDPSSTGPVAPYAWMESVIQYGLKYIPPQKFSLGIPLYYWKWNSTTGKLVEVGGYSGLQNALKKPGMILGYDPTVHESFLNYSENNTIYTIWFENAQNTAEKIALINTYGLQGFSAWSLGLESPDIYNVIR